MIKFPVADPFQMLPKQKQAAVNQVQPWHPPYFKPTAGPTTGPGSGGTRRPFKPTPNG